MPGTRACGVASTCLAARLSSDADGFSRSEASEALEEEVSFAFVVFLHEGLGMVTWNMRKRTSMASASYLGLEVMNLWRE